jgi:hypothetical protein
MKKKTSIKTLSTYELGKCPKAVFNLLSKFKTLQNFDIFQLGDSPIATTKMASQFCAKHIPCSGEVADEYGLSGDCRGGDWALGNQITFN